jgi:hypothetical protein
MNKSALATIIGTALLGLSKKKLGSKSGFQTVTMAQFFGTEEVSLKYYFHYSPGMQRNGSTLFFDFEDNFHSLMNLLEESYNHMKDADFHLLTLEEADLLFDEVCQQHELGIDESWLFEYISWEEMEMLFDLLLSPGKVDIEFRSDLTESEIIEDEIIHKQDCMVESPQDYYSNHFEEWLVKQGFVVLFKEQKKTDSYAEWTNQEEFEKEIQIVKEGSNTDFSLTLSHAMKEYILEQDPVRCDPSLLDIDWDYWRSIDAGHGSVCLSYTINASTFSFSKKKLLEIMDSLLELVFTKTIEEDNYMRDPEYQGDPTYIEVKPKGFFDTKSNEMKLRDR